MMIEVALIDHDGNVLSTTSKRFYNTNKFSGGLSHGTYEYDLYKIETIPTIAIMTFKDVNIDDMQENIYVKITKVNDIDTATAMESGYVNISLTEKEITYPIYRIFK
jgi:hypothetical protein